MGEYVTNHHAKALLGEVYCRRERLRKNGIGRGASTTVDCSQVLENGITVH
jgi:hypothetical protein